MNSYRRPPIDALVFRDAEGEVIDYGHRWAGSPPEDTYSVDTHPARFAPLHTIAQALIAHLRETYDVEVEGGAETAEDLLRPASVEVMHAVRIRPKDPACASLTFVFTAYPGIVMHAGLLSDFPYPVCGCDACDSTWQGEADELERQVHAVVTGNYRERIYGGLSPWIEHRFTYPDGSWRGGSSRAEDAPAERLSAAKSVLLGRSGGWAAWPPARPGA